MNTLKLLAVKNGTLRIAKVRYKNTIHIKSNNPTTISYLLKMWGGESGCEEWGGKGTRSKT